MSEKLIAECAECPTRDCLSCRGVVDGARFARVLTLQSRLNDLITILDLVVREDCMYFGHENWRALQAELHAAHLPLQCFVDEMWPVAIGGRLVRGEGV